jgi:ABC-type glycerol-3-phosphate transport system substrate-binding protein
MLEKQHFRQKLLTLTAAALALVSLVVLSACSSPNPTTSQTTTSPTTTNPLTTTTTPTLTEQADDIVTTPDGWDYRANVTQQGQTNPFQSVQITDTVLTNSTNALFVIPAEAGI